MKSPTNEINDLSKILDKIKEKYEELTFEVLQFKNEYDEYNRLKSIFKERIFKILNKIQLKIMKNSYINYYIKSKEIIKKIENMNLTTSHEEINILLEESKYIIKKMSNTNSLTYLNKYLYIIKKYKKSFRIEKIKEIKNSKRRKRIGFIINSFITNKPTSISRVYSSHNKEYIFSVNKQLVYKKVFYSYNRNIILNAEFIYKLNYFLVDSQYDEILSYINSKMKFVKLIKNSVSQGFKIEILGNTKNYERFINDIINYFQDYLNDECIEYRVEVYRYTSK